MIGKESCHPSEGLGLQAVVGVGVTGKERAFHSEGLGS